MSTSTKPKSTPAPLKRPATADHLRSQKKPIRLTVDILLEDIPEPSESEGDEAWDAYRQRVAEATATMTFQSIGRKRYDGLVDAHPPTEQNREEAKQRDEDPPAWNPETFMPALVRASCAEPELSEEDVQSIFDEWNQGELLELWQAALYVNTQRRTANLGKGFGRTKG